MDCPPWLWRMLLRRYWPPEFLHAGVAQGIAWCEQNQFDLPRSEDEPIFIFAAGWRSGSTLLQRLLNSHPEVFIWGEPYEHSLLLYHLSSTLAGLTKEPLDLNFLPRNLTRMPGELASSLTTKWIAVLTPPVADLKRAQLAYLQALFGARAGEAGRPRWGLKLVRATATIARYLRWLYPKAKMLYLFRSPYAAFQSYKNATKGDWYLYYPTHPVKGVLPFVVHWRYCMNTFLASHREVGALLVPYESLLDRQALGPLQEYLGFQLDPGVLDLKVDIKHEKTRTLTKTERTTIGFIAGDAARRFGYTG